MMMTPLIGGSLELRYFYFRSASGGQKKISIIKLVTHSLRAPYCTDLQEYV